MKKVNLIKCIFLSLLVFSFSLFHSEAKTIDMDGEFDDWDDVDILIEDTIAGYPYSGTIYYFDTDTNTWGTDEIENTCMYTQDRALDLGQLKITNDNDYLYILWQRGSDFLNYYWRDGDATEEMSFDDEAAIEYENNPCVGEIVTAPIAFDHDIVLSIDTNNDESFDYYLVINVTFDEGAYDEYYVAGYIYEDEGNGSYSREEETLVGSFADSEYDVSVAGAAQDSAVLQEVKMDIGEVLENLDIAWGDTVTVKYETHSEAVDDTETAEYIFTYTEENTTTYNKDSKCRWKKPEETTWIKLEPETVNGVSGMFLTWVQYDADKIDIFIDDGTDTYPWKVDKTINDGHAFLPNVASWQKIKLKPYNNCKAGDMGEPVSAVLYPNGWYNIF